MNVIKFGRKKKHLKIPDDWELVTNKNDVAKHDDKYCYCGNPTSPYWRDMDRDFIGDSISEFDFLIRKLK